MTNFKKKIFLTFICIMLNGFAHAEDIDLYDAPAGSAQNPNVIIMLDNSPNWARDNQGWPTDPDRPGCGNRCSKQGYYELKAIRKLMTDIEKFKTAGTQDVPINIGLMMFNDNNASRDGAYVRSHVMPMTQANRQAFTAKLDTIINNFITNTNTESSSSSLQYSAALFDAFKYFGGHTNPAKAMGPYPNPPSSNPNTFSSSVPIFGTKFWGTTEANAEDPAAYTSADQYQSVATESCGKNFIVFIGNGFPGAENEWGDVLAKLYNPDNPTPISQNLISTYAAGTNCTDATLLNLVPVASCVQKNVCESTLVDLLANVSTALDFSNTETSFFECKPTNNNSCNSSRYDLEKCNVVITEALPTSQIRYADEYTGFLSTTDVSNASGRQSVTTYTIDVYKNQQDTNQTALLRGMAKQGKGQYYAASNFDSLVTAFSKIFAEIQSDNSVFASSSLPVSVNTQGTYLNQVFIGMFKPDGGSKPRWYGNLKQYQFKFFGDDNLRLADFSPVPAEAISATNGFITPCAISAWTSDTGEYWKFDANSTGLCETSIYSDSPDGANVEKGGAAQRLRGVMKTGETVNTSTFYATGSRNLKTCSASNCTGLTNFDTSNTALTSTALGVDAGSEANLINWVRGKDVDNENFVAATSTSPGIPSSTDEMRPSSHGGVVHSQPAVVDYGGTIGVVSFYGADDGVFHAVNGNKELTAGNEYWGFIAPEHYTKLNRLKQNKVLIKFPTVTTVAPDPAPQPKDYFFDGSVGVFQRTDTTVDPISNTVWIYPTMRRGGRAVYAFNVSTPSIPVLKWRRGCYTNNTSDDASCDSGWSDIGQTWSKPQIAYLSGYVDGQNKPKPVLIFGGGYDTCEDTDSQVRCTNTPRKGANIWFVDADNGNIIRKYPTNYSVPGDITLLTDGSGYVTYAYAADTGGYIYRVNVGTYNGSTFGDAWTSNTSASSITIASMSETNQARKFLFGPDVIVYKGYNAIAIGSGDREHPLSSQYACNSFNTTLGSVLNQFYIIKDVVSAYSTNPITPSSLTDVTDQLAITESQIGANGLRFDLVNPSTRTPRCEQTVNKALTIGGVTYFGTNGPKTASEIGNSCGINLGNARGYAVNFLTGAPIAQNSRSVIYKSGGLPPSPVGGVVDVDGKKQPFCIGCTTPDDNNPSPLQGSPVTIKPEGPRQRVYWYLEAD